MRFHDSRPLPSLPFTLAATAIALVFALVFALGQTALAGSAPAGRKPLAQPKCDLCIVGTPVVQWNGSSGSFHVDGVENHGEWWLGGLELFVALDSRYPDFQPGQFEGSMSPVFYEHQFSDLVPLNPLARGDSHSNINSGTIGFSGSKVPAGEYWMFLILRMEVPNSYEYQHYVVMNDKVTCDGSECVVSKPCSTWGVAGAWGYTKTGTLFHPTAGATPFATMGILTLEKDGTLSGVNTGSVGGKVSQDVLKGTFEVNPDCTGTTTVEVYDQSGVLLRTIGMALVVDENATHLRGLMTSLTLPNGTLLPTVITADSKRVSPKSQPGK